MSMKRIFFLAFFLSNLHPVFPCPFDRPSYESLKASENVPPFILGVRTDVDYYLPGGDEKAFYESYFNSQDETDAAETYAKALSLEQQGKYREAARIYKSIDRTRKTIGEWGGFRQMSIFYPTPSPTPQPAAAWGEPSVAPSFQWVDPAYADPALMAQVPAYPPTRKAHKKRKKFAAPEPDEDQGLAGVPRALYGVTGIPVPPTRAWMWMRAKGEEGKNFVLAYQEAADRSEIYSEAFLAKPGGMVAYLKARAYFLDGNWNGCLGALRDLGEKYPLLSEAADNLNFACLLGQAGTVRVPDSQLAQALDKKNTARKLLMMAKACLGAGEPQEGAQEAQKYLQRLLDLYPKSRYADDACFLLAKAAIVQGDAGKAGSYFRDLALKHGGDDLVPAGYLTALAVAAEGRFQRGEGMGSLEDAFWKLSGGPGDYDPEKSDLKSLPEPLRPYLRLWASEKLSPDDPKRLEALKNIAASAPVDHVIRREAVFLLATKYRLQSESFSYDQQGQNGRHPDLVKDFTEYSLLFLKDYPEDPRVPYLLQQCVELFPNDSKSNQDLAAAVEDVSKFHLPPFLGHLAQAKGLGDLPFGKDRKLNEKFLIDTGNIPELLDQYPDSPWAFAECLGYCGSANADQAKTVLKILRNYRDWFESKGGDKEKLLVLDTKLAALEMMAGKWAGAFDQANDVIGHGPKNRFYDEALWVRARCLEKLNRPQEALKVYKTLVTFFPEGAAAVTFSEDFSYGQQRPAPQRDVKSSPYSPFAYAKVGAGLEASGDWGEAMEIYEKLGYKRDIAMTADMDMPVTDLESFVQGHPNDPQGPVFARAVAMRLFRQNDFDGALKWIPAETMPAAGVPSPTPGVEPLSTFFRFRKIKAFRRGSPSIPLSALPTVSAPGTPTPVPDLTLATAKSLSDVIRVVQGYYQAVDQAADPDAKSFARYDLGRLYFYSGRALYYNSELWDGLWYNDSEEPLQKQKPVDDAYHIPFYHYRDAGYQFYQITQEDPQSPILDRALYSYPLCLLKAIRNDDQYLPVQEAKTTVSDFFYRVYQQCPDSSLADDALFWAGFESQDKIPAYYQLILQNYGEGDLLKFFTPDQLMDAMKSGIYDSYGKRWSPADFLRHNEMLRHHLDREGPPQLVDYSYPGQVEEGKPFSGWLYYRSPGGERASQGILHLDFQGLESTGAEVDLNGKSVKLPPGKAKSFVLKSDRWPPGITRWVYFKVDRPTDQPVSAEHYMEFVSDGVTTATQPATLSTGSPLGGLKLSSASSPITGIGAIWNYRFTQAADGETLWEGCRADGKSLMLVADKEGRLKSQVLLFQHDCINRGPLWFPDDSLLDFPAAFYGQNFDKFVTYIGPDGRILQKIKVDPKKSYEVTYQKGAIIIGNPWSGGQTIGTVPGAPDAKDKYQRPSPPIRVLATDNMQVKDVEMDQGLKAGFLKDVVHFQVEAENQYIYPQFLGSDDVKRFYFLLPQRHNDATATTVFVLDANGGLVAKESFPAFEAGEKVSNAAFAIIPSGGVMREYLDTGDNPALVVQRLTF